MFLLREWLGLIAFNRDIVLAAMSAVVQFVLTGLGVAVAVKPALAEKYSRALLAAFALAGLAGIVLTVYIAVAGSQETARRAKETLDAITGGDTYPLLIPQYAQPPNAFGLIMQAVGRNTLSDINFSIIEGRPPYTLTSSDISKFLTGQQRTTYVRFVPPDFGIVTGATIYPSLTDISAYTINVFARNGSTSEFLEVRFTGDSQTAWDYRYVVRRGDAVLTRVDWHVHVK